MSASQPPPLPDILHGITLREHVNALALEEPDPRFMDLRVLGAFGLGQWIQTEIELRIVGMTDPAQMLSDIALAANEARFARLGRALYFAEDAIPAEVSDRVAAFTLLAYWGQIFHRQEAAGRAEFYEWMRD
ncbi:hypothetical protein FIBSPDRAFT_970372, partial [Athelia psychrophila]